MITDREDSSRAAYDRESIKREKERARLDRRARGVPSRIGRLENREAIQTAVGELAVPAEPIRNPEPWTCGGVIVESAAPEAALPPPDPAASLRYVRLSLVAVVFLVSLIIWIRQRGRN